RPPNASSATRARTPASRDSRAAGPARCRLPTGRAGTDQATRPAAAAKRLPRASPDADYTLVELRLLACGHPKDRRRFMSRPSLRSTVAAVMLLVPVAASFMAQPAQAQTRAQPAISNMSLNSDAGLSAGATLRVQVYATANAQRASVTLGDSGVTVPLRQQTAGNYTG